MFAHKLTQQSFRGVLVASALDQCVKNKPILIDRAPKPMFRTIDCDDDFIEMPFVAELRRAAADFIGEVPTKFLRPTPHGFMADDNPPHGQHVFNHPQADRETKIEPNRVGDHLGGETMTTVQGVMSFHPRSIPAPLPHSVNVTVPYVIADNQLALKAGWDEDFLAEELEALMGLEPNFDLSLTGFSIPEIDGLIAGHKPEKPGNPDDDLLPDPSQVPRRCNPGDIFRLGRHRLICGDARDYSTVAALMDGELARMVFTDPPYNVPIAGNVGGLGQFKHGEFAMASGEMTKGEFTAFLKASFTNLVAFSHDGSIHFICMDWRHMGEMEAAAEGIYSELKNLNVWVKHNAGMGSFYRSQHELIFVYKNGTAPHINNFELGQHGRYRTNVWEYAGATSFKANRLEELALHPTVKPVQMLADAIKDVSARGDIVLDLFGGSGSTLIAAHKTGRRAYLCEYDPLYCDKIIARFEAFAHEDAEFVKNISGTSDNKGDSQ